MSDVPSDGRHEQEEHPSDDAVRDLLASAGSAGPVPADVARRLDDTLADLVAERSRPAAPVADLTERRRRRWPQVLVAAATVGVIGIAVGTAVDLGGAGGGDASTASRPADGGAGGAEAQQDGLAAESRIAVVRLRTATLRADAQRVEDLGLATSVTDGWQGACVRPTAGPGSTWTEALLDGERALLLLRAPAEGRRVADVYLCPSARTAPQAQTEDGVEQETPARDPSPGAAEVPVSSTTVRAR